VRMETPVLYFYSPHDVRVDARVRFPKGTITEWFPDARVPNGGETIAWSDVKVSPSLTPEFPIEPGKSHYYAARGTDATPLESHGDRERFLFYRGVGNFTPPVSAIVNADGRIDVASAGREPVGDVILFENRGGSTAYEARHSSTRTLTFDPLTPIDEGASP